MLFRSNLDHLTTRADEVDLLIREASNLVPAMENTRYVRVYAGVRPLVLEETTEGDRQISRTFTVFDHEKDGLENMVTVAGGKLTTYRLMAEKATDLVCSRLGVIEPCKTAEVPLPGSENQERLSSRERLERLKVPPPLGTVICECEMVGRSEVDKLADDLQKHGHTVCPNSIRIRSRLGMGACQGGFCGLRTVGLLYEKGMVTSKQGNDMLTDFLEKRFSGIKPMLWGDQLRQEQFLEAIYCGSLNIDGNL